MTTTTTYGSLVINDKLPPELRDLSRKYDKRSVDVVLKSIRDKAPELYSDVSDVLLRVGNEQSHLGGLSFSYKKDFGPSAGRDARMRTLERDIDSILKTKMPDSAKLARVGEVFVKANKDLEKSVVEAGGKRDSVLFKELVSGARGNPSQLRMVNEAVVGVMDYKDNPIPIPITKSYTEGLRPYELFAAGYGARKGLMSTKMATADTGSFAKAMTIMNIDTVITEDDCKTSNGVMYDCEDTHNDGRVLAASAGGYPAGTVLTIQILSKISKKNVNKVRVRTVMTCQAKSGGICSTCFGLDENGKRPKVGDNIGVNAAQGMAEPLSQMSMDTKHTGGAVGSRSTKKGGFPALRQLLTVPKNFPGAAAIAPVDGRISDIKKAPQGGSYIHLGSEKLYIPEGHDITVKKGDMVDAGQQLSDGLVNPNDVAKAVGIGEARNSLVTSMRDVFKNSGMNTPRRHMELMSRNMLNFAESTDRDSGHLPGDVFKISPLQEVPGGSKYEIALSNAKGKYLARSYLHHTIGTKITVKVLQDLNASGVSKVVVSDKEPPFVAKVTSIERAPLYSDDFIARLGSRNLKKTMLDAGHLGMESKIHGTTNPIPAFAFGAEFGKNTPYY